MNVQLNAIELTFAVLFFATIAAAFASRLRLPSEVMLVICSLVISLIPGLPEITLEPDLVFLVFLPPILFSAAFFTSWRDFKFNLRPISLLAVGLVVFTTVSVGIVAKYLIPQLPWAHAFLLGAIVSPPDASAATAITKKLGVPRRLVTVIEGESLVNDATALVCYRFALAAILTGSFSVVEATWRFAWVAVGGALVGFVITYVCVWLMQRLKDHHAEVVLQVLTAFVCYILAEHLGVSGVISTVAGGLFLSRRLPVVATAQTRMESRSTWHVLLFVINGLVFTLIGLQLPTVVRFLRSQDFSTGDLLRYAAIISFVVILVRIIWVFPATYVPRWLFASIRKKDPSPPWQPVALLSWIGMRGIVSLAAALSIPAILPNGDPFPFRNLLIFLAYSVILTTLVLPALTLPTLTRIFGIEEGEEHFREEAVARVRLTEQAIKKLNELSHAKRYSTDLIKQFRDRLERRLRAIRTNVNESGGGFSELVQEDMELRRLTRETIETERKALQQLRKEGAIHDEVFHILSRELDLEDLRLRTPRL